MKTDVLFRSLFVYNQIAALQKFDFRYYSFFHPFKINKQMLERNSWIISDGCIKDVFPLASKPEFYGPRSWLAWTKEFFMAERRVCHGRCIPG